MTALLIVVGGFAIAITLLVLAACRSAGNYDRETERVLAHVIYPDPERKDAA